jgi:O-antigen ligase
VTRPDRCVPYPLEWAWMFLCWSSLSFAQRTATEALSGSIDATNFQRFGFVCIALIIVALQLKRVPRFRFNPISVFLVYVVLGVCSTLWSAGPVATMGKSMELLAAVLVVWITMARADAEARLRRLTYWVMAESVLGLLYVTLGNLFDPSEFHVYLPLRSRGIFDYEWSSPQIGTNSVSQLGALVSLFCLALASEKRRSSWFFILSYLASAAFPVLAQGRTGMISLVVGTGLILARRFPISSVFTIPAVAGLAIILFGDTLLTLFLRGQDQEELLSLSGRTTLWDWAWTAFLSRPWLGSGWGEGSRVVFLHMIPPGGGFGSTIASVHSGVFEVLLGVGLVGFAIWAWAVVWSWWQTVGAYLKGDSLPFAIGMVVPATATFLSTGTGGWLDFFVQYFLAVTALLSLRQQQQLKSTTGGRAARPMLTVARQI